MIGAMYENGGNTTHRFLDGHPQLRVYPFESQLGTALVQDRMASLFPVKYRWPVFALHATAEQDFRSIIDEECRVRARTPHVSKFRHVPFDFSDEERGAAYGRLIRDSGRSRGKNVEAFFRATFEAWKDFKRTKEQSVFVGYSPIVTVDADKILEDLPGAHVLHVVRNPWSAYADTKKRPVPLGLDDYVLGWTLNQYHALLFQRRFPKRVHVLRIEDVLAGPRRTLGAFCRKLGLDAADALGAPTWNGSTLSEVYPWGAIRKATPEANRAAARELSARERGEVRERAWRYLDEFDYRDFLR
ncbi:MAG: sulfotransferase [Elusimicrobia bacterium]|nr:sulfotransferase [Elusimicrobiota bacterium]